MPMYDYRCKKCGHIFEELVFSWDKEKEIICPNCSVKEVERLIGAPITIGKTTINHVSNECCQTHRGNGFS